MKNVCLRVSIGLMISALTGCILGPQNDGYQVAPPNTVGGGSVNDRTGLGGSGEPLLTGVMEVSPSGNFAVMQRNTLTVLLDVKNQVAREFPMKLSRVVLSKTADIAYAMYGDSTLVALDLNSGGLEAWRTSRTFSGVSLLRVSDDSKSLVVVEGTKAVSIDPMTGAVKGDVELPSSASYGEFLPNGSQILIAGHTVFTDHVPATPVSLVDLQKITVKNVSVPNCEAPISVLPDGTRAMLSPTFCQEDRPEGTPQDAWTNPDPVSIIDIAGDTISFKKNLPGFGPVALSPDGSTAVAYLDMARIDRTMFEDPTQIPDAKGPQYHLMVIEPKSLGFELYAIGNALPRFAMSRDGQGLLVDASVQITTRLNLEAQAQATVSVGIDGVTGDATASIAVFGLDAPFGYFHLSTGKYSGFKGPKIGLDRFVQLSDNRTVVALSKRPDGLGGEPYRIDLPSGYIVPLVGDYGRGLRDIGLLPDGKTILLRLRQQALQIDRDYFGRESYGASFDGFTYQWRVEYQSTNPFYTEPPQPPPPDPNAPPPPPPAPPPMDGCPDGHDC